jgi:membrane-associated phospholipid phosphatase
MTPRILEATLGRAKELGVGISDVDPLSSAEPTSFGRVPFVTASNRSNPGDHVTLSTACVTLLAAR